LLTDHASELGLRAAFFHCGSDFFTKETEHVVSGNSWLQEIGCPQAET
jgi:hypothetical protein